MNNVQLGFFAVRSCQIKPILIQIPMDKTVRVVNSPSIRKRGLPYVFYVINATSVFVRRISKALIPYDSMFYGIAQSTVRYVIF